MHYVGRLIINCDQSVRFSQDWNGYGAQKVPMSVSDLADD